MADNAVTDHYRKKTNKPNSELSEDILLFDETESKDSSLQLAEWQQFTFEILDGRQ